MWRSDFTALDAAFDEWFSSNSDQQRSWEEAKGRLRRPNPRARTNRRRWAPTRLLRGSRRRARVIAPALVACVLAGVLGVAAPVSSVGATPTAPGLVTGLVIRDYNGNGAQDPGTNQTAVDTPIAGVVARLTCLADTGPDGVEGTSDDTYHPPVDAAASAVDGTWSVETAGGPCRVDFDPTTFPDGMSVTAKGPQNGGTVQFVAVGDTADLALNRPSDFCQDNPLICQAIFLKPASAATIGTVSTFPYSNGYAGAGHQGAGATTTGGSTGFYAFPKPAGAASPAATRDAALAETGPVYGVAWQPQSRSVFVSAYLKVDAVCDDQGLATPLCDGYPVLGPDYGFGPGGVGGVYRVDLSDPAAPVVSQLPSVPNAGVEPYSADLVTGNAANARIGAVSLGDMEFSGDRRTLYVTNLNDRIVYQLPMNLDGTPAGSWTPALDFSTLTAPGCTPATESRPFGLGWKSTGANAGLFVGLSCGWARADGTGSLHVYSAATGAFVLSWPQNYYRFAVGTGGNTVSDIDFDEDDMILGERSLVSDRNSAGGTGDIQRACYDETSGAWTLEAPVPVPGSYASSSTCGGVVTTDPSPGVVAPTNYFGAIPGLRQGPTFPGTTGGQSEWYYDDSGDFVGVCLWGHRVASRLGLCRHDDARPVRGLFVRGLLDEQHRRVGGQGLRVCERRPRWRRSRQAGTAGRHRGAMRHGTGRDR